MGDIFKINENYKAILKLEEILTQKNIPHDLIKMFDGWGIFYPDREAPIFDVIEHLYSYGSEKDLLEAMGEGIIEVEGFLSVEEALKFFEIVHENTMKEKDNGN